MRSEADTFPAENDLEIRYKCEKFTDLSQAYLVVSGKVKICELPHLQPALCLVFDLYNATLLDLCKSEQKELQKVAAAIAERKIEGIAFDMKKSYTIEGQEEWLEEKKQKEVEVRMEAKKEANLQSRAMAILLHYVYMHRKGVAEAAIINYSEFCKKKKQKYQKKCPEKGYQCLIHSSNGKTCRKLFKVRKYCSVCIKRISQCKGGLCKPCFKSRYPQKSQCKRYKRAHSYQQNGYCKGCIPLIPGCMHHMRDDK